MHKLNRKFVAFVIDEGTEESLQVPQEPNLLGPIPVWINGYKVVFLETEVSTEKFYTDMVQHMLER